MFGAVPRENLIEDNGAEGCGANPSHREGAELECEVAGPCRKRGCDGDQISWVGVEQNRYRLFISAMLFLQAAPDGRNPRQARDREGRA